jgi:peptidoglycan/LPS O-acetylase OafA/YrhL
MLAIVFMHCGSKFLKYQNVPSPELALMVQPFKFGTIGFFLISGFLLGDRLPGSRPLAYLRRRANRIVPAWALWYALQVLFVTGRHLLQDRPLTLGAHRVVATLFDAAGICLTGTALWFVPNFILALTLVVLLGRWLNDLRTGAVLLTFSLFYALNIYGGWVPPKHTEALLGFVFYLWLGAWCALRKEQLQRWIEGVPKVWLFLLIGLAGAAAVAEFAVLSERHSSDPMNTLRFSNQIYSVLVVILLLQFRRRTWPRSVNVAQTTYGIYLTHSFVVSVSFSAATAILLAHGRFLGPAGILVSWLLLAPTCYLLSLQMASFIAARPSWRWAVGGVVPDTVPDALVIADKGVTHRYRPDASGGRAYE